MKNKHFLLLIFLLLFLSIAGFANAALEITSYPQIPGLISPSSDCTGNDCLSIFIAYWFGLLIYIAGILSLISFTVGAVGLINPNPESHNDAKDRMKGAILGLVLTLASFLIIRTINPVLITPSLTPLPGVQGVFYIGNGNEKKPVGIEVSDVKNRGEDLVKNGFNSIIYDCNDVNTAPALLIWKFPKTNFMGSDDDYGGVNVARVECGNVEPIAQLGSFRMAFETPGVYYCLGGCSGNTCSGYMSGVNPNSQDSIDKTFAGKIKGVKIVNGPGVKYGALFHEEIGLNNGGACTEPIINYGTGSECHSINNNIQTGGVEASAVDIFRVNTDSNSSGSGVSFFSEPYGWDAGADAGFYEVTTKDIALGPEQEADKMCFNYKNVNQPNAYQHKCSDSKCKGEDYSCDYNSDCDQSLEETCVYGNCVGGNGEAYCSDNACETFQDCPGSIKIKGSYLVAIYSKANGLDQALYCQTFNKDVENINTEPIIASGGLWIVGADIIPTK